MYVQYYIQLGVLPKKNILYLEYLHLKHFTFTFYFSNIKSYLTLYVQWLTACINSFQ